MAVSTQSKAGRGALQVKPAEKSDFPLIERAFAREAETRPARCVSYLAEKAVSDFHRDRLLQSIEASSSESPIRLLLADGELAAVMGTAPSPMHSERFGVTNYKIQPFYCFMDDEGIVERIVNELRTSICTESGSVYSIRIGAENHTLDYMMGLQGFAPVGMSVRMAMESAPLENIDSGAKYKYDTVIRDFDSKDLHALQDIGRRNHRYSHFFNEPRFSREDARELFADWIRKCVGGVAQHIYVAENNGQVIGFSILLIGRSLEPYIGKTIGVVDFIAVDGQTQGKGIGKLLLDASLGWFKRRAGLVELRTMADNLRAIRFYEKNGFRILSADQHYHLWT